MKKLSIAIILILSILILAACGSSAKSDFTPFWGQINKDSADGNGVLEYSEYKISVAPPLKDAGGNVIETGTYKLDSDSCSGSYSIEISRISKGRYKVKTEFEFKGKYTKDGTLTSEFTDSYTGECIFEIVPPEKINMISSKKTVSNATFCNEDGSLSKVSYTVTNTYEDSKIFSKFDITEDKDNLLKDCKSSFEQGGLGEYFFDNEALYTAIRAFKPKEGFSLGFKVPENISQTIYSMSASYVEQKEENMFSLDIGGQKLSSHLIQVVRTGTGKVGAPIKLYYSKDDKVTYQLDTGTKVVTQYFRLLKFEHGDMIYTLDADKYLNSALKKT